MSTETTTPIPTILIGSMQQTGSSIANTSASTNPIEPISFAIVQNEGSSPATYTLSLVVWVDALNTGAVTIQTDGTGLNFFAVSGAPSINPPHNVVKYTYTNANYSSSQLADGDAIVAYNCYQSSGTISSSNYVDSDPPFKGTVQPAGGGDPV